VSQVVPARRRPPRQPSARTQAAELPVARVAVDVPLAHLDRPFDYLVPQQLASAAVRGCRVRVRFAGKLTDGYLLERAADSDHPGRLAFLERVVSPEPVLTAEIAGLARAVADHYAGTLADVLRLAIPPRHAATESRPWGQAAPPPVGHGTLELGPWAQYPTGAAFLAAIADGRSPRAAWSALPGQGWPHSVAVAVAAAASAGRGAVVVVPEAADLARVDAALSSVLGPDRHVALSADLGPAKRYRRWLAAVRGSVRVVAGTRSAMFAPVRDLGLVVLWDDGDDLHAERRAPYPHAREVLALRAHRCGAAALIGGFARTAEMTQLVEAGWARTLRAERTQVRSRLPEIHPAGDDSELARDEAARAARLPSVALRAARDALARGPVLVQVPRRGYLAAIGCARCRTQAHCAGCGGPLALESAHSPPHCRWCGRLAAGWRCTRCLATHVRALVTGVRRTAEELGRAFPSAAVRVSGGDGRFSRVPATPALVVATPGAEPAADGGYAAALLLDAQALLSRADLRAGEEALRRWMNAAALVRPRCDGGIVVVLADAALPAVQALIRWDSVTYAQRELSERAELGFPPAVRMASVTGSADAVHNLLNGMQLPDAGEILGPVPVLGGAAGGRPSGKARPESPDQPPKGESYRALVRVPRQAGRQLARALADAQAARSARKDPERLRVQIDPLELI
jgi:primosomal protein N' (replication factor Y)